MRPFSHCRSHVNSAVQPFAIQPFNRAFSRFSICKLGSSSPPPQFRQTPSGLPKAQPDMLELIVGVGIRMRVKIWAAELLVYITIVSPTKQGPYLHSRLTFSSFALALIPHLDHHRPPSQLTIPRCNLSWSISHGAPCRAKEYCCC
jgi:hypothetical protein